MASSFQPETLQSNHMNYIMLYLMITCNFCQDNNALGVHGSARTYPVRLMVLLSNVVTYQRTFFARRLSQFQMPSILA